MKLAIIFFLLILQPVPEGQRYDTAQLAGYDMIQSSMPVINQAPLSPRKFTAPLSGELRREKMYAILPTSVSFPKSTRSSGDQALPNRAGRKQRRVMTHDS